MANPPWDMKFDETGWSWPLNYVESNIGMKPATPSRAMLQSSYNYISPTPAEGGCSWFMGGNWNSQHWAKCFKNVLDKPARLESFSFKCCSCNSKNQPFTSYGGGLVGPAAGYGCKFTVDIAVPPQKQNGNKSTWLEGSSQIVVPSIKGSSNYNCSYNGVPGNVDNTTPYGYTSFGRNEYFSGDRARTPRVATFTDAPLLQPGEIMYVHARITWWEQNDGLNALTLISYDDGWDFTLKPENRKFLWIYVDHKYEDEEEDVPDGPHWRKIKDVYQQQASGWVNLGKDDDK